MSQTPFPRIAPDLVHATAPALGRFTDEVLFGTVWADPALSPRDRSLVTVAALIAGGKAAQTAAHARRALDNGLSAGELAELTTHLAFYSGWPNAMSAVAELAQVFAERGLTAAESPAPRLPVAPEAEARRRATVATHVAPTAPALAALTDAVLFADLWLRPDLAPRDRSLATVVALIVMGQPEQMPFHLNRAMDNGLSPAEAAATVTHLAFYAGWPRAMSAVATLKEVLASRA